MHYIDWAGLHQTQCFKFAGFYWITSLYIKLNINDNIVIALIKEDTTISSR